LLGLRGFQDGIADVLGAEGVAEVGVALLGGGIVEGFEELGELVGEGVLVAEAEAWFRVGQGILTFSQMRVRMNASGANATHNPLSRQV
jgi:hypothetical protein